MLAHMPLTAAALTSSPLTTLQDAIRVVTTLDSVDFLALVGTHGATEASSLVAPVIRKACGLQWLSDVDAFDLVARVHNAWRTEEFSATEFCKDVALSPAQRCSCGGVLTPVVSQACDAAVHGRHGTRDCVHIPKRCRRAAGASNRRCGTYMWCNYEVFSKTHYIRGDVNSAKYFFVSAAQG